MHHRLNGDLTSPPWGGHVASGYGLVKERFVRGLERFGDGGGSFAVYVDGELVIDLWGGWAAPPDKPWAEDTLAVMMSATKAMAGLCVQVLVERGQLDIEAPVAQYWPEFAANGKGGVLVRHVLTHTSGVLGFDGLPELLAGSSGFGDHEAIAEGLAASTPSWSPGEHFGYHALSYGWLLDEIVRRVSGSPVGSFFASEIAGPLGLDINVGTPVDKLSRVARILGFTTDDLPFVARPLVRFGQRMLGRDGTLMARAYGGGGGRSLLDTVSEWANEPSFLTVAVPASNGTATARSIARLYAAIANGGELDGVRILSPQTVRDFSVPVQAEPDALLTSLPVPGMARIAGKPVYRSLGYLINPSLPGQASRFGPSPRAYGHDGAGGQLGFCDADAGVAVGFLRNHLTHSPAFSAELLDVLYRCLPHVPSGRGAHRG